MSNVIYLDPCRPYDRLLDELAIPRTPKAIQLAQEAFEDHFARRRGCFVLDDGLIALFDNNAYRHRDGEIRKLVTWLSGEGHKVVGGGSYPESGEDKGYTLCLVVRAAVDNLDHQHRILKRWKEIISQSAWSYSSCGG